MNRSQLVKVARRIAAKGWVAATDGNLSIRVNPDHMLVTRSGVALADLTEDDLVTIDGEGRVVESRIGDSRPSSEFRMHRSIYATRPDAHAVVHAHPPYAIALSIVGRHLDIPVVPEVIVQLHDIPTLPYTTPTTEETAAAVANWIGRRDALVLAYHGVVTTGHTLESAYQKLEKVEHTAQVLHAAYALGPVQPLTQEQINKLEKLRPEGSE